MVFQKGNSIHNPPVKLLWIVEKTKDDVSVKAAFSVPKRNFKKAVTRNLLKRRMREAYRKNKIPEQDLNGSCLLIFTYSGYKISTYSEIESKIVLTLQHFKTATAVK